MAKKLSESKLLKKIAYYTKLGAKRISISAGWDKRSRNAKGEFPAYYMKLMEFGTSTIPPRRLMYHTGARCQPKWKRTMNLALQDGLSEKEIGDILGEMMAGDIRDTITMGLPPPNSPATQLRKIRQGKLPVTLRDTLYAFQSVTYIVGEVPK